MGGGVVEGLIDSFDMDPRVRFAGRFGKSKAFEDAFFSTSLPTLACTTANFDPLLLFSVDALAGGCVSEVSSATLAVLVFLLTNDAKS